jgi:hypothetical protein
MTDDPMAPEKHSIAEANRSLAEAINQMEVAIGLIVPEESTQQISAGTPAALERLAQIIRELPGNWT